MTLAGFRTFKGTGIQVATNQIVRTDAVLQVGGMAETVTVAAAAAMQRVIVPTTHSHFTVRH